MKRAKHKPRNHKKSSNNTILKQQKIRSPYINTLMTILGVYIPNLLLLINKGDAIMEFMKNQSEYGGLIANILAILVAAYSRFLDECFLHKRVYWLSFFAFCTAIGIFEQSNSYIYSDLSLTGGWTRSFYAVLALHMLLIVLIFALYKQKCWHVILKYNKFIIK